MEMRKALAVIGGGSAGFGAALAAARLGVDTLLVERESLLGGTSTTCGVNCWEPVAGATGIPFDLYQRMRRIPSGAAIYSMGRHCCHPKHNSPPFPGGENVIDPTLGYDSTLQRSGSGGIVDDAARFRELAHGVVFEPEAFHKAAMEMLKETGRCEVAPGHSVTDVKLSSDGEIESVALDNGDRARAGRWIDCSGALIKMSGCETLQGDDPKSLFQEPDAPEKEGATLNGVTLIFRIAPVEVPRIEELPAEIPASCWWSDRFPAISCTSYPNGERNCNMLPTMNGNEHQRLGEAAAYAECVRRVKSHWHNLQLENPEFRLFRLSWIAPRIGVRESFRTVCEYMLNENDLLQGLGNQQHNDIIAISDHMMDSHGASGRKCAELAAPYGIPYRCLIPKGKRRMLVAGRIAGFSSIAASSCRLARTMMQLGQAAGSATALSLKSGRDLPEIGTTDLRESLIAQRVLLEWPMPEGLRKRLRS